ALDEAVRRGGSIAGVDETPPHTPGGLVGFDGIAGRGLMMAGGGAAAGARGTPHRGGRLRVLPAGVATPPALVLPGLLQNATTHGRGEQPGPSAASAPEIHRAGAPSTPVRPRPGLLQVSVARDAERLTVVVEDDGRGLPDDFDLESANSLGLQIVRTL